MTYTHLKPQTSPTTQWRPTDVVLRVGVGCQNSALFPQRCNAAGASGTRAKDALRVYKSGALYLANENGSVIPDVQAELEKRATEIEDLQKAVREMQDKITLLEARGTGDATKASEARSKIFNET